MIKWLNSGHERSARLKKHISFSFILKGLSILISLVFFPLLLDLLGEEKFGIWLTISSVITWFTFFDVGLGNGLRNRLAESMAKNDLSSAKTYVSTTYALVFGIALLIFTCFLLLFPFIDWGGFFNAGDVEELGALVFVVFSFFCLQFVVKLITMIMMSEQRPALNSALNTLASAISLLVIYMLYRTDSGSLVEVAIAISGINLLVYVIASILLFGGRYKAFRPSYHNVDLSHSKDLLGLGAKFFVLQGAALIVMATDNMIITQVVGPGEVPAYNAALKYFSIITMVFTIVTTPFWSAFTEAWQKGEKEWIQHTVRKVEKLWFIAVVVLILMIFGADQFYKLWLGDRLEVPFLVSFFMAFWVFMATGTAIYSNFLSGVNKVRISFYHAIFVSVINIPLSILFAGPMGMGSAGVILATCLCVLPRALLQPIQYRKLIAGKANGLWSK